MFACYRVYNTYMRKLVATVVILFLYLFLINHQEAQAYINPGSGSYIFQTIIGGLLSIFYLFKKLFLSILGLFKKDVNKDE